MRTTRTAGALLAGVLTATLAGCGDAASAEPPEVTVTAGPQEVTARPTQYCGEGQGRRYSVTPPIVEVSPDTPIALTVPEEVAQHGWAVQVFDESLEQVIGEVDVEEGATVYDGINTSDVVPPAFYLVVVEDKNAECSGFAGAWPVGFLRAGGQQGGAPAASTPG